jgi:hypothetical protein
MKPLMRIVTICAASTILLATGCNSTSNTSGPEPAFSLFVVQNGGSTSGDSVLQFPANGSGSIAPSSTVTSPSLTAFDAVAVDTLGNLYISTHKGTAPSIVYQILVYAPPTATGAATLTNTITSSSFSYFITSIAVDSTGEIYALNGNSISVFAANASTNATPVRQISGNQTQIGYATQIAVDAAQNIYVASVSAGNILVFSSTETGNTVPAGILAGTSTVISTPTSVAVDSSGNIYVASFNQPSNSSLVLEFSPGSTGNVAPVRTLTSVASDNIYGLTVDALDNLYVCVQDPTNGQFAVDVFSSSVSGSNAPTATITSTAWTASTYGQIAVR